VLDRQLQPTIEAIGLPLDEDIPDFIEEACSDVSKAIGKLKGRGGKSVEDVTEAARLAARRAAQRWSGKRAQVRVILAGGAG
jgi:ribonuclease J